MTGADEREPQPRSADVDTAAFRDRWGSPPVLHGDCDELWEDAHRFADALDAARAEVERLQEVEARLLQLNRLFDQEDHEWFKERCELYSRAEAAEAKLARVRALCEAYCYDPAIEQVDFDPEVCKVCEIRVALGGDVSSGGATERGEA